MSPVPLSVAFRPPRRSDWPSLARWRCDPETRRALMLRGPAHPPEEEVERWLARRADDPTGVFFILARAADDAPIGFVQLTRIDREARHAYLGLFLAEEARGTGMADEALLQIERRAAEEHGLAKLCLETLAGNVRALRFWSRSGYRLVGRLEGHHPVGGVPHDVLLLEKPLERQVAQEPSQGLPPIANDAASIQAMHADEEVRSLALRLLSLMGRYRYAYNWTWWGRPVIQLPQDLMALQTIVLEHRPDLIIETGVAHGGSLVFHASMLELLGAGRVIGIDVDIRAHNRRAIEAHPLSRRIELIEGSSVSPAVAALVRRRARGAARVMVCLDSNHTAEHVARELELYSPLVTPGAHLVVFDTAIEDLPAGDFPDRAWGPGNSPKTAVRAFLAGTARFVVDHELERRLLFSVAPEGYLRCVG